jgi:hypothetical protein
VDKEISGAGNFQSQRRLTPTEQGTNAFGYLSFLQQDLCERSIGGFIFGLRPDCDEWK